MQSFEIACLLPIDCLTLADSQILISGLNRAPTSFESPHIITKMLGLLNFVLLSSFYLSARAHEGHDIEDQVPMGYVKYPYQAQASYSTQDTGTSLITFSPELLSLLQSSDRRFDVFWHHDIREAPLGAMLRLRQDHAFRYRLSRRPLRYWHKLPSGCPVRALRHSCRLSPPDALWRLQRTSRSQSIRCWAQNCGLW